MGNLCRAIVKKMTIKMSGNKILSIDDSDVFFSYTDFWRTPTEGENGKYQGISPPSVDVVVAIWTISLACPGNENSPPLDDATRKRYEIFDLFRVKTPAFLSNYKNPCWKQDNKLVCLSYFYQIGFPKCGSTLTFTTIVGHPEAAMGVRKEPQWFARRRFKEHTSYQNYLDYFLPAARVIQSKSSTDSVTGQKFHPIITGSCNWLYLPWNYNCTEPRVLIPHYIHHLNPFAKVIIVIRKLLMISMYTFLTPGDITTESFHARTVHDLATFEDCCSKHSLRFSLLVKKNPSPDLSSPLLFNGLAYLLQMVRVGLYHVFIRDWMKVFPADQILVVRLEDIRGDLYRAFTRIFDFLGLSHVSRSELKEIIHKSDMNGRKQKFQAMNETRRLLDDFYRPHNIQLARLLRQHDPNSYSNIDDAMYSH
ncbi:carbohydrate sulfotransferase 15-like [Haliotis asinina]|uniref:carbohydrate sulfotransferase 15-like n=1 Tax=Haliotis asinina TaxID=109174 RepID=UPI00353265D8